MRQTQLILVEGLPGSGKSTTAHALTRLLASQPIPARWWYEEDAEHPVYIFRDRATLQELVEALERGAYQPVIAAALEQWRQFEAMVRKSDRLVIIDSCLFGYLTWSLFPFDIPGEKIRAYVVAVAEIIEPLQPTLIYFRQDDIAASLARLCARRGGETERRFIERATQSPYGRRHGLEGFDGMVAFWTAYRQLTDSACAELPFPTLSIETSAGDWSAYWQRVLAFLDLSPLAELRLSEREAMRFAGQYRFDEGVVTIGLEGGDLFVDGLPHAWPRNRLIPTARNELAVESLPFTLSFEDVDGGRVTGIVATGPRLLDGTLPEIYMKL